MAGLLGLLDNPGAQLGLGLLAAAGPSPVPMSFGQRAAGAVGQFQAAQRAEREAKAQEAIRELQAQMMKAQMLEVQARTAERQQAHARQQTDGGILRNLAQGIPADGMGPPTGKASLDPLAFFGAGGSVEGLDPLLKLNAALAPKPRKLTTVAPGASVIDEADPSRPVFTAPAADKAPAPTELAKLIAERDRLPPNDPQRTLYDQQIKKITTHAPAPSATVTLPPGENEFVRTTGKNFAETYATINQAGFNAPQQLRRLERIQQLLEGVDGGRLSPIGMEIASAANSLGIKIDPNLGNKQAAESLAREIATNMRQPGTGPMTDKDLENFLAIVPNLAKTAEGRRQIMTTMRAAAARDMQLSKMARDYVRRNRVLDEGFFDEAAQFMAANPVVTLPEGWQVTPRGGR